MRKGFNRGFLNCRRAAALLFVASNVIAAAALQLVSTRDPSAPAAAGGGGESGLAVISANGRFVLFASTAENLALISNNPAYPTGTPKRLNVFLRDRTAQTTMLVSVNSSGTGGGNGDSLPTGISTNGQYALFESSAFNLVSNDTNNANDVFVRDLVNGVTLLVSAGTDGSVGNGPSRSSSLTPDGRYVAFVSAASNLVAGDTNGIPDVFVRDLQTGTTTLVSVGAAATNSVASGNSSESPAITPDGRYVGFYSTATNLVTGAGAAGAVYVRDLVAGNTILASADASAILQTAIGVTNVAAYNQAISDDGRYVFFEASTNHLLATSVKGVILRYDSQTGLTDTVFTNANVPFATFENIQTLDVSPDGRFVAMVGYSDSGTNTAIYLWDGQTGASTLVSGDLSNAPAGPVCRSPVVSADGRYVAFVSNGTNLTTDPLASEFHVYLRDMQTGTLKLADLDVNGVGSGVNPTTVPSLSSDGRYVTFESADGDLVPNDRNHDYDVFLRDLTTGTTELISARSPGLPSGTPNGGPGAISSFSVSANGRYVAFSSQSDDLVANQPATHRNVFVHDLLTGTNILVSVDTNGVAAAGDSMDPSISGDGRYVAFSSTADNLVPGDTNMVGDVFVRDLQTGTTTLASVSTNGVDPGNYQSLLPTISADGRFILFRSRATDLVPDLALNGLNLFLRDLQIGTTYALTANVVISASMTPDGHFIAFADYNQHISVWDSQSAALIYTNIANALVSISPDGHKLAMAGPNLVVIDLIANTNWVIGATPVTARSGLQFSADGRFLTYATSASVLPSDTNGTRDVYVCDLQTGVNLLVSRGFNTVGSANGASDSPVISADGRFIAYRSTASNSLPNDFNDVPDLVVYDRVSGASSLISVSQSGNSTANNRSLNPVFSGDGRTLVFQSWASDLLGNDFNNGIDLFALKLGSGTFVDSDGDGMDDQWELENFSTLDRDGTGDLDGDGATDLFEFRTGTDPTNALSVFRVEIISVTGSGQSPAMTWPVAPGKFYRVQFKDDLNEPVWQDLQGNVTLVGGSGYATDLVPTNGQRFYRVILEP